MKSLINSVRVVIGQYTFKSTAAIRIEKSWRDISPTCTIQLPALGRFSGKPGIWERVNLNVGDGVSVNIGYDGQLREEFVGYVASIDPSIPYTIKCEGEGYQLKRKAPITKSYASVKLKSLLEEVLKGEYEIDKSLPDVELSPFSIRSATPAQVLEKLSSEYIFAAYFRGKKLYIGLAYSESAGSSFYKMPDQIVSDNGLSYRSKGQQRIKIKAVSINSDNTRTAVEVGDAGGELRTLNFRNIKDPVQLRAIAEEKLGLLSYNGYEGSFEVFGLPYVDHGYTVELDDVFFPERGGKYVVDKVVTDWGYSTGFRRTITLGRQV